MQYSKPVKTTKHPRHSETVRHRARKATPPRMSPSRCCCYIVECADGTFYTGWAIDPEKRLREHNAGRGARYTRMRRPVKLVYVELQPERSSAMKRERAIKRLTRQKKLALIQSQRARP